VTTEGPLPATSIRSTERVKNTSGRDTDDCVSLFFEYVKLLQLTMTVAVHCKT
jgi:hypothetical protein